MYCASCGTPITPGLSFCNRCGARLEDKPQENKTGPITAYLTAITLIGISGLGIMFAGALVLKKGADLPVEFVALFTFFTFLLTGLTEVMLIKNLTKLSGLADSKNQSNYVQSPPLVQQPPLELRPPTAQSFGEPVGSVTENTTRTLEYARRER
ncbi:MAG TPA: hypothetical protein VI306_19480 [Pyrinomonadaceae bacterium]